jgi:four helix bundle protein
MAGLKSHRDLDAWKVGMTVVEQTYSVSRLFPSEERYRLTAQMRKAAVSIPSNVAEGFARGAAKACLYFVRIALGSNAELDTQLEVARRLRFVTEAAARDLQESIDRERQILHGMRRDRERQISVSVGSFLLCLALGSATLFT